MIDKADFDPKIPQPEAQLEQVERQIRQSRRHKAGQSELFLVFASF
ncbi:hypothetical protein [Paraburkholderia sp.]|nr:hypothetical protein [Paraburkholderia sp.]